MKNFKSIIVLMFCMAIMVSCNKEEQALPETDTTNVSSKKKVKQMNEKSASPTPTSQELYEIVSDLEAETAPDSMLINDAILNVEYALNYVMSAFSKEEDVLYNRLDSFSVNIPGNPSGYMSGSDILSFYQSLYTTIYNISDTVDLPGTSDIYVMAIDVKYNEYHTYLPGQNVVIYTSHGSGISPSYCSYSGDYYISQNLGGCGTNAGSLTGVDVSEVITAKISNHNCNSNIEVCAGPKWSSYYNLYSPAPNSYYTKFSTACVSVFVQDSITAQILLKLDYDYPMVRRNGDVIELYGAKLMDKTYTIPLQGTYSDLMLHTKAGTCVNRITIENALTFSNP